MQLLDLLKVMKLATGIEGKRGVQANENVV